MSQTGAEDTGDRTAAVLASAAVTHDGGSARSPDGSSQSSAAVRRERQRERGCAGGSCEHLRGGEGDRCWDRRRLTAEGAGRDGADKKE